MRFPAGVARLPLSCLLALALSTAMPVAAPASGRDQGTQQAATRQQLAQVRHKMEALAREQAQTAARRDHVTAELARQANALAAAARAVREADQAIAQREQQLQQLQQQQATLQDHLQGQRQAIAQLLRATYALGRGTDLQLLLGNQDLAQIARTLAYSRYFQQDRLQRVRELMGQLSQLQQLQASISAQKQALETSRAERAQQVSTLAAQRAAQRKLLAQTNARYQDQASRLAALQQNAQSLNHLLAQLQQAIDEAAREAARSKHASAAAPSREAGETRPNIRGSLPWPASGKVVSYGHGVLIKADGGSEVHAVARGRVVYAAFLRGYGMLIILNHGDGWMSMYGNNETLLHGVGDQVEAGETLGVAASPTGLNTGVYFELRQHGKPVDPRDWLSHR